MKNMFLAITVLLTGTSGLSAQAEALVCPAAQDGSNTSESQTMIFRFPVESNGVNRRMSMVLVYRAWLGQLLAERSEASVPVTGLVTGNAGHRKWTLASTGSLEFMPSRTENGRYYGSAFFVRPRGPEIAQQFDGCYLDAAERN